MISLPIIPTLRRTPRSPYVVFLLSVPAPRRTLTSQFIRHSLMLFTLYVSSTFLSQCTISQLLNLTYIYRNLRTHHPHFVFASQNRCAT